jgi:peptidoglycan/xylan/chitin deacetylase (PgdA/CDA1 family)
MLQRISLVGVLLAMMSPAAVRPAAAAAAAAAESRDDGPRVMAVTFDDLPSVRLREDDAALIGMTARLIVHIARHGIPAIGFVNEGKLYRDGRLDEGRVELLRMWCEAGYELGNHTCSHIDLHRCDLEAFEEDVVRGEQVTRPLLEACGLTLRYFRHPLLHTGRNLETKRALERFLADRGYRVAPVTIDSSEWIFAKAYFDARERGDTDAMQRLVEAYVPYMEAKIEYFEAQSRALFGREIAQVLLLHANHLNADHLGALAEMIERRGYRWVSLDEALSDEAYASADIYTGPAGISWIHRWAITAGREKSFFAGEPLAPQWVLRAAGVESE